ncbi:MAG: dgt [Chthoniobacteraceae bacterium]|nr:dgt [Chthoniobacteraceae bacterium]
MNLELKWFERKSGSEENRPHEKRKPFERDRARLIHSAGFRRLQGKTQVLGIAEGDFHRTRLTHSMEVGQIARGLVLQLRETHKNALGILPPTKLIESISFGHDVGHPPFGHSGECALNYMMRRDGGFEGNAQSLRLLAQLEAHTSGFGLDLTRRTLLGILKYPRPYSDGKRAKAAVDPTSLAQLRRDDWKPPKCYYDSDKPIVDWLLEVFPESDRILFLEWDKPPTDEANGKPKHRTLDCSLMEAADDIAYGVHDFEDGIALGLITRDHWECACEKLDKDWAAMVGLNAEITGNHLFEQPHEQHRKKAIGGLVHAMIASIELDQLTGFTHPLLSYRAKLKASAKTFLEELNAIVKKHIIDLQSVQTLEYRGRFLVTSLFQAIEADPKMLLGKNFVDRYEEEKDSVVKTRVICDYIAGMTDAYASRMYERLFLPRHGTVFERL